MLFSVAFLGVRGGLKTAQDAPRRPQDSLKTPTWSEIEAKIEPKTVPKTCKFRTWKSLPKMIENTFQIDFKIDQKTITNFFQNQTTNKSYFSFIFDQISIENLMFKQNGRFSKIVPKPSVFVCFLNIRSCKPKQTRDMQRIEKSLKTIFKNQ